MGSQTMELPYQLFTVLEDKFGREGAMTIADSLKQVFSQSEARTVEAIRQTKLEVKDEVKKELISELATKEDIAHVKSEIKILEGVINERFAKLEGSNKLYFIITIAVVLLLNKDSINLITQLLGIVK